jgi:hypothetical protein
MIIFQTLFYASFAFAGSSPNSQANADLKNVKYTLDDYFATRGHFPASLKELPIKTSTGVYVECAITSNSYVCVSDHEKGSREFLVCNSSKSIYWREHKRGTLVRADPEWFKSKSELAWKVQQ